MNRLMSFSLLVTLLVGYDKSELKGLYMIEDIIVDSQKEKFETLLHFDARLTGAAKNLLVPFLV